MITDTYPNYIFIRVCISLLQLIAPFSIGYIIILTIWVIYNGLNWPKPICLCTGLFGYAMLEAGLYLGVYLPRKKRMQGPPVNPPPTLSRKQRGRIFDQCLASVVLPSTISEIHEHETTTTTTSATREQDLPYPSGWFLHSTNGVPNIHPSKERLIEWLLWALFSTSETPEALELHREELETYVQRIEGNRLQFAHRNMCVQDETLNAREARATSPDVEAGNYTSHSNIDCTETSASKSLPTYPYRSMRVTLDPVVMLHRPLLWYFIVCIVDTYTTVVLLLMGFKHYTPPSLKGQYDNRSFPPRPILSTRLFSNEGPKGAMVPYWYRPHIRCGERKMPMIFLHGIGIGLYPYMPFFRTILSNAESTSGMGMIIPELLPISMHMTDYTVPSKAAMLESLDIILEHVKELDKEEQETANTTSEDDRSPLLAHQTRSYGGATREREEYTSPWDRVVLCGHSYGTFVAGWIVRECVDGTDDHQQDVDDLFLAPDDVGSEVNPNLNNTGFRLASKIAHIIMVDPIPILLSNPAVAKNFLYRHPSTVAPRIIPNSSNMSQPAAPSRFSSFLSSIIPKYGSASAWQLFYFASRDADVARTLFRAFFWAEGGLWAEEVEAFVRGCSADDVQGFRDEPNYQPSKMKVITPKGRGRNFAVVLGGQDQVIPAHAIRHYLTGEKTEMARWFKTFGPFSNNTRVNDKQEEDEVVGLLDSGASHLSGERRRRSTGAVLEVLFNPVLDHAVVFDEVKETLPLVDVVRRYVHDI